MFRKYKDFINKGEKNKILYLDKDWYIKTPLMPNEVNLFTEEKPPTTKQVLDNFKYHIDFMIKYPKFFPKVKKLDKYRTAVEKLDTKLAKKELKYVVNYINAYIQGGNNTITILDCLYKAYKDSRIILGKMKESDDIIVEKWYNFIWDLRNEIEFEMAPDGSVGPDLHDDNIGIDKEGNIKLLDF
jgi:hypothetical protein